MELQIKDHVASVRSCLQYVNEEERPLEAVFVFPLPADAAVCHFSAKIEERGIVAEVQDRQSVSRRLLWRHLSLTDNYSCAKVYTPLSESAKR